MRTRAERADAVDRDIDGPSCEDITQIIKETNMDEEKTLEELDKQEGIDRLIYALHMIDDQEGSSLWMDDRDDAANFMLKIARVALRLEQP